MSYTRDFDANHHPHPPPPPRYHHSSTSRDRFHGSQHDYPSSSSRFEWERERPLWGRETFPTHPQQTHPYHPREAFAPRHHPADLPSDRYTRDTPHETKHFQFPKEGPPRVRDQWNQRNAHHIPPNPYDKPSRYSESFERPRIPSPINPKPTLEDYELPPKGHAPPPAPPRRSREASQSFPENPPSLRLDQTRYQVKGWDSPIVHRPEEAEYMPGLLLLPETSDVSKLSSDFQPPPQQLPPPPLASRPASAAGLDLPVSRPDRSDSTKSLPTPPRDPRNMHIPGNKASTLDVCAGWNRGKCWGNCKEWHVCSLCRSPDHRLIDQKCRAQQAVLDPSALKKGTPVESNSTPVVTANGPATTLTLAEQRLGVRSMLKRSVDYLIDGDSLKSRKILKEHSWPDDAPPSAPILSHSKQLPVVESTLSTKASANNNNNDLENKESLVRRDSKETKSFQSCVVKFEDSEEDFKSSESAPQHGNEKENFNEDNEEDLLVIVEESLPMDGTNKANKSKKTARRGSTSRVSSHRAHSHAQNEFQIDEPASFPPHSPSSPQSETPVSADVHSDSKRSRTTRELASLSFENPGVKSVCPADLDSSWSCTRCTLINVGPKCSACSLPRPRQRRKGPSDASDFKRFCLRCGAYFGNDALTKCTICLSPTTDNLNLLPANFQSLIRDQMKLSGVKFPHHVPTSGAQNEEELHPMQAADETKEISNADSLPLRRQSNAVENDDVDLFCGICSKSFKSKGHLKVHLKSGPHLQKISEQLLLTRDEPEEAFSMDNGVTEGTEPVNEGEDLGVHALKDEKALAQEFSKFISFGNNAAKAWSDYISGKPVVFVEPDVIPENNLASAQKSTVEVDATKFFPGRRVFAMFSDSTFYPALVAKRKRGPGIVAVDFLDGDRGDVAVDCVLAEDDVLVKDTQVWVLRNANDVEYSACLIVSCTPPSLDTQETSYRIRFLEDDLERNCFFRNIVLANSYQGGLKRCVVCATPGNIYSDVVCAECGDLYHLGCMTSPFNQHRGSGVICFSCEKKLILSQLTPPLMLPMKNNHNGSQECVPTNPVLAGLVETGNEHTLQQLYVLCLEAIAHKDGDWKLTPPVRRLTLRELEAFPLEKFVAFHQAKFEKPVRDVLFSESTLEACLLDQQLQYLDLLEERGRLLTTAQALLLENEKKKHSTQIASSRSIELDVPPRSPSPPLDKNSSNSSNATLITKPSSPSTQVSLPSLPPQLGPQGVGEESASLPENPPEPSPSVLPVLPPCSPPSLDIQTMAPCS